MIFRSPSISFWLRRKIAVALTICLFMTIILEVLVSEGRVTGRALSGFVHFSYFLVAMLFATLTVNVDKSIRRPRSSKNSLSYALAILYFSYVSLSIGFLFALTLCITNNSWHTLLNGILTNSPGIGLYVGARYSIDFRSAHTNDTESAPPRCGLERRD